MKTRIDHTTVVTCRVNKPIVLHDTSIVMEDQKIIHVGPTGNLINTYWDDTAGLPALGELKGRPLGVILNKMGKVTETQILEALNTQKNRHGVIGQTLIELGYVTNADVEQALAIQAGRLVPSSTKQDLVEIFNGQNHIVIPGLINTHHHLFQSLTRCMPSAQNAPLFDWLTRHYQRWQALDYDALRLAATISLAELLSTGCTTTSDHHYLFPADGKVSVQAIIQAADSLGMRLHIGRGSMSLGASDGGLPPDACVQNEKDILADSRKVIDRFHDPYPMAMCRVDLAPCAPFLITPGLMEQTRDLATEKNVLLHTHAAETLDEEKFCLDKYGVKPIELLYQLGWLGPQVYLAHCVQLDDHEIEMLAETQTAVAHCPSSNMRLGSGIAPVRRMLDAGIKVGIAVDGSSSNDGGNVLAEARQALFAQRAGGNVRGMSVAEAFKLATTGGAEVLHRNELGRIEPGCAADLVLYNRNDIALAGAIEQDPLGALMLCHTPRPEYVFINGKTTLDAGRIVGIDLAKHIADFNQLVRDKYCG